MGRDRLKDETYFRKYLERENRLRKEAEEDIKEGEVKEEQIPMVQSSIFSKSLQILIARYSVGEPTQDLYLALLDTIEAAKKGWNKEYDYNQFLWLISISVLMDLDKEHFQLLSDLYKESPMDDFLLNYLFNVYLPASKTSKELLFTTPYITLQSVINNPDGAISLLKKYVEKQWYRGHKDTFWYNRHTSKFDIYSGYWSWESAAIVKRLGLDDTELKDVPYYPYDMVHGK